MNNVEIRTGAFLVPVGPDGVRYALLINGEDVGKCEFVLNMGMSEVHQYGYLDDFKFGLPGGAVDFGETPQDGAVREALEELGVWVMRKRLDFNRFEDLFCPSDIQLGSGFKPGVRVLQAKQKVARVGEVVPRAIFDLVGYNWQMNREQTQFLTNRSGDSNKALLVPITSIDRRQLRPYVSVLASGGFLDE